MLSDTAIKRLQSRATPYRIQDECGIPGFGVQVTPAGGKGYFLRYSHGGKRRYLNLGHWPQTPLSAARDKARAALAQLDQGLDPQALPEPAAALGSFQALIDAWLAHQADRGRRRLDEVRRALEANVPAVLRERPAASIQPADIRGVLATVHQRGSRVAANRLRSALHTCFQYGLLHDHDPRTLHQAVLFGLTSNPVSAVPADPGAEVVGERVIQAAEIAEMWNDNDLSWPVRQGVRLLFATCGQRVNEIIQAPWTEFDFDNQRWVITKERTKNKREHDIPLTDFSIHLLDELRKARPQSKWLFPSRNIEQANQPWSDTSLSHAVTKWLIAKEKPRWTPRDIRRTVKTEMGKAGISKATRDLLQNHAVGIDVSSKHYDRYDYWQEKKIAAEVWSDYLQTKILGIRP